MASAELEQTDLGAHQNSDDQTPEKISPKVIKHISPEISPRAVHIENYQNSRQSFMNNTTLKNIEDRVVRGVKQPRLQSSNFKSPKSGKFFNDTGRMSARGSSRKGFNDTKLSRATSAGKPPSERVLKRLEDQRNNQSMSKKLGNEAILSAAHRKNLEHQVRIMENRILRLQVEEQHVHKKINETSVKTEKTLESKLRHQDKLTSKENKNQEEQKRIENKKNQINQERTVLKVNLKQKTQEMLQGKSNKAATVKDVKQDVRNSRLSNTNEYLEKSRQTIQKIVGDKENKKDQRMQKANRQKSESNASYVSKIDTHKEKVDSLENRLKELEEMEINLVEKLKNTYSVHKSKYEEYQKIFSHKVSTKAPLDIVSVYKKNENQNNKTEEGEGASVGEEEEQAAGQAEGEVEGEGEGEGEERAVDEEVREDEEQVEDDS